ncbi:hypothetical protein M885DRAFT_516067 [Pelagophyceae sp. CCMP2097]|nr:hypothetical protein M885DRAFT_516067 [Pelagophyceae sp. CCMP2097]
MIVKRGILVQLASGSYTARLEDVDLDELIHARAARAPRPVVIGPIEGDAASYVNKLRLDPMLLCIIFDHLLSNAIKYGDETIAPAFCVGIESLGASDDMQVCCARIELHNAAGPQHAKFLELGDDELNRDAAEGRGHAPARDDATSLERASPEERFPMVLECARALGGSVRLTLTATEVVATLTLPRASFAVALSARDLDLLARLSYAIVDDSMLSRKQLKRVAGKALSATRAPPLVAGETRKSIEGFARAVVAADVDVVFIDQNFGTTDKDRKGTDLVCSIRALDAAAQTAGQQRLVFIVSANDSKDDRILYKFAGADDCLSKGAASGISELLRKHAAAGLARVALRS